MLRTYCVAVVAYVLLIILGTFMFYHYERQVNLAPLPACTTDSDCEYLYGLASVRPIPGGSLIGYDCGPHKVTLWAIEEDEFPVQGCNIIESA